MFGELVCGPPGSGKTTYCEGKRQFLSVYDPQRPVVVVNLDPANEGVFPYPCDVDVRDVVCHENVMTSEGLGPNGTYIVCASILEDHLDWLMTEIETAARRKAAEVTSALSRSGGAMPRPPYVLIDSPGQIEVYINSTFMHKFVKALQKRLQCSIATIHLVDAGIATRDIPTFVSACLLALTTMVDHELPHLNVMSKWDVLTSEEVDGLGGESVFLNPSELLSENFDALWRRQLKRHRRANREAQYHFTGNTSPVMDREDVAADAQLDVIDLKREGGRLYSYTKTLLDVVDGYGLVGYVPLSVASQEQMLSLTQQVDNAIGLFF